MPRWFAVVMLIIVVTISSCNSRCRLDIDAYRDSLTPMLDEWNSIFDDTFTDVAAASDSAALDKIKALQAIRSAVADVDAPTCTGFAHTSLLLYMDHRVNALLTVIRGGAPDEVKQYTDKATEAKQQWLNKLDNAY